MKIKIIFVVFLLSMCTSLFAQDRMDIRFPIYKSIFKEAGIKGYSITQYDYIYRVPEEKGKVIYNVVFNDKIIPTDERICNGKKFVSHQQWLYNADGTLSDLSNLNDEKALKSKIHYKYDGSGKVIEVEYLKKDGTLDYKDIISYNAKNLKSEETRMEDNELKYKNVYTYDAQDRLIDIKKLDKKNEVDEGYIYKYTPDGKLAEDIKTDGVDVKIRLVYTYYPNGLKQMQTRYKGEDDLKGKTEWKYNASNLVTEEIIYDSDGDLESKTLFNYNRKGLPTDWIMYERDDALLGYWKIEYNEKGLPLTEQYLNKLDEALKILHYKYDPDQK